MVGVIFIPAFLREMKVYLYKYKQKMLMVVLNELNLIQGETQLNLVLALTKLPVLILLPFLFRAI